MKKRLLLKLSIISIFLWQGCTQNHASNQPGKSPLPEKTAPSLQVVNDFSTIEHLFHQNNDTTYLLNFWATTCPPCLREIPLFEKMIEEKKGQKFKIILFNTDGETKIEKRVIPYLNKQNLHAQLIAVTDPYANRWTGVVNPDWYGSLPYTIIYRGDKRKYYNESFESYEELKKEIDNFMR